MGEFVFSYTNYISILKMILDTGSLCDYSDVQADAERPFIILRHDVEFSPRRALELATLEHAQGVASTYFFQLTNNAYNALSGVNVRRILRIRELGHRIGLHFHLQNMIDIDEIARRVAYECRLLSDALGFAVDRFSYHRPSPLVLEHPLRLPGIISAYDPLYFTFYKDMRDADSSASIKYIADSRNAWSYTEPYDAPCDALFHTYPRIQMLCHPYSWTADGHTTLPNLQSLIAENRSEFIDTMNAETKYVKEYLHAL